MFSYLRQYFNTLFKSASVNKLAEHERNETIKIIGKPSLTEQIYASGKMNKLYESRALLDSLKQVFK